MKDKLTSYVDLLFAGAPNAQEMKQEILQNTLDRYDDLVSQGKSPEAAYTLAIAGIGDVSELTAEHEISPVQSDPSVPEAATQPMWRKILRALAVFLYILCPLPLFILSEIGMSTTGLCGTLTFVAVATALIMIAGKGNVKKSKKSVRIVLIIVAAVLVTGILCSILGFGSFVIHFGNGNAYTAGPASVSAADISRVKVEWAAGNITVSTADTDEISFEEEGSWSGSDEMVYLLKDETLHIRYARPGLRIGFFSTPSKNLVITVPSDWAHGSYDFDSAAADITVTDITSDTFQISSASGEARFTDCSIASLNVDTASGSIHYDGMLDSLQCNAASANVTCVLKNVPSNIDMDSASGDLDITFPADCGFRAEVNALSGRFQSEYPTTSSNNEYLYGDGSCKIDFNGASGNIWIRKGY